MDSSEAVYIESYVKCEGAGRFDGIHTIPDCLKHYAETVGDGESIVFAEPQGGRRVATWTDIYEKSNAVARSLIHLGVRKGELIAVNIRSCPEWLFLVYGAMAAGAIPVSISFTYKNGSDLIAMMKKLERCCLLALDPGTDGMNWDIVKHLVESYSPDGSVVSNSMPSLRYLIKHEGAGDAVLMQGVKTLEELISEDNSSVPLPEIDENDVAVLLQTSGSTGVPKLVAHTHKSILVVRELSTVLFMDNSVIQYNDRPFSWIGGFPMSPIIGQKRVTVSGFIAKPRDNVASVIDIVCRERCTLLTVLPPMMHALIRRQDELPADWPLRAIVTGGQPLTIGIAAAVDMLTTCLSPTYGSTECIIAFSAQTTDTKKFQEFYCGNIVSISGLEAKIVDESGEVVPIYTRGEIYLRSPGLFKEYYHDPEKTSAVMAADGWYKTDDIGMMTDRAEFFVYGRKSHMIISGGMNVAPEILEHTIKSCPGVAAVAIVPVSDDVKYQVVCACVIREEGSRVTEEKMRAYCEEVHNDKPGMFTVLPTYYMFLNDFPETTTGKTSRKELTKIAENCFRPS